MAGYAFEVEDYQLLVVRHCKFMRVWGADVYLRHHGLS